MVGIISRCGLTIDVRRENQPNQHKLALYKASIHFSCNLKLLYVIISSKMKYFSYKGGCGVTYIKIFKRRATFGYNKWFQVISNIM